MFTLPNPLHPAIVHFPIVLLLLGAVAAVAAVGFNRWNLPWIAAVLLVLGSLGAFAAAQTGESAEHATHGLSRAANSLLDDHQEWAEQTETAAAVAAALAIAAAALGRFSWAKTALGLRALTAAAALLACYFLYETGRAGGKLVYEYGVGVQLPAAPPVPAPEH